MGGRSIFSSSELDSESPEHLLVLAAHAVLRHTKPLVEAYALYKDDPGDAYDEASAIIYKSSSDTEDVANACDLRGLILHQRGVLLGQLGASSRRRQKFIDAEQQFAKALTIDAGRFTTHLYRAELLIDEGRFEEAVSESRNTIVGLPWHSDARSYYTLGNALYGERSYRNAEKAYRTAIRSNFSDPYVHDALGKVIVLDKTRQAEAMKEFTTAIALEPTYAHAYDDRGLLLIEEHNYMDAKNDCAKAIHADPRDAVAHAGRGRCYLELKLYKEADSEYAKSLSINATD